MTFVFQDGGALPVGAGLVGCGLPDLSGDVLVWPGQLPGKRRPGKPVASPWTSSSRRRWQAERFSWRERLVLAKPFLGVATVVEVVRPDHPYLKLMW